MIPPREEIEHLYIKAELDKLDGQREINDIPDARRRDEYGRRALRAIWPDEAELIQKTHWIQIKDINGVLRGLKLFQWNYAQQKFYKLLRELRDAGRPIRILILKARQLGFSTFMQSWQWEQCDRDPNRNSLTVSFDEASVVELFTKVQVIRRNLWFPPPMKRDRDNLMETSAGSTFHLRTAGAKNAGRSQTIHNLHCSECAMWDKADDVFTGVSQSVPSIPGTSVVLESTAQGAVGSFYEAWRAAESGASDYSAFFAPWYWDPDYRRDFAGPDSANDFGRSLTADELRIMEWHNLSLEQLAWRRWKIRNDCQGSVAKFRQEFPATASEAFLSTGSAVFDADAVAALERSAVPPLWIGEVALQR